MRRGDYTDAASLEASFRGVDKLLFVSTSALGEERMRHHRNVVAAARRASVGHMIYTSVIKPAPAALFAATPGHFQTEALIAESGIPHTFFRNNLYMDLIPFLFAGAAESGVLMSCAGEGRVGYASVAAEEFRRTLTGYAVPAAAVEFSVALGEAMRAGEFDETSVDLQTLLGRTPTELDAFLSQARP